MGPDSPPSSGARLTVTLYDLSEAELQKALEIAKDWPGGMHSYLYQTASSALAWHNPAAALEDLLTQKPDLGRSIRLAEVMALWARRDPEAAWKKWLENGLGKSFGSDGMEFILVELGKKDLSGAFDKLRAVEKGDTDHEHYGIEISAGALCEKFANTPQRQALMDEVLASEPRVQTNCLHVLFRNIDFSDPKVLNETLDWMRQRGVNGPAEETIYAVMFRNRMERQDPAATAEWYQSVSPAKRARVLGEIVNTWGSRDPDAAGDWLNRQEPGPELDPARSHMAQAAARTDLDSGFAWAATITDRRLRLMILQNLWISGSRNQSSEAVRTAIQKSPVSFEDRKTTADAVWPWH